VEDPHLKVHGPRDNLGKIAKHIIIYDGLDVSRQLGLLPADDSMGSRMLAGVQHLTTPIARRLRRH
jgi:hypothetical protein